jgi:ribosomal protein S18 acetylase RimI-like enzyme
MTTQENNIYELIELFPQAEAYVGIRQAAGLSLVSYQAAVRGLPNTLFGVSILLGEKVVGMGRVIGDGGCFYHVVDIAVLPEHQGRGLGKRIMNAIMAYIEEDALPTAYISLIADAPDFYRKYGFRSVGPRSEGMYKRIGD